MRILVVDDEPLVREDIAFLLNQGGYATEIDQACDGQEALAILTRKKVEIVLLDICMPGMDGLCLLKQMRSDYPQILVIIISGWDSFVYAQQAMRDGAIDYLLKPIDQQSFDEALNRVKDKILANRRQLEGQDKPDYGRLQIEQVVNQVLLGSPVHPDVKKELDLHAMAVLICHVPDQEMADEWNFTVADWLNEQVEMIFGDAKTHIHVVSCYTVPNEWLLIAGKTGDSPFRPMKKVIIRLKEVIIRLLDQAAFSRLGMIHATMADLTGVRVDRLKTVHDRLLDTLQQRFCGNRGFIESSIDPVDVEVERLDYMRQALALQISAGSLSRDEISRLISSIFTRRFFMTMTAAQAQTVFATVEAGLMDAFFNCAEVDLDKQTGGKSLLAYYQPDDVIAYLLSYLPLQHGVAHGEIANLMQEVRTYVRDNFLHALTLHDLAERFYINPNYLSCMYKVVNGINFIDDLTSLRMVHACKLLQSSPISIARVAELSGYASQAYFQKVFKKHTGKTPNEYRLNNV